jgi:hypothetical protein
LYSVICAGILCTNARRILISRPSKDFSILVVEEPIGKADHQEVEWFAVTDSIHIITASKMSQIIKEIG